MGAIYVYKQSDLDNANINGVVSSDVIIYPSENISLRNVKKIDGNLHFSDVTNIDLGDIEEITGYLSIGSYYALDIVNFSKLKKIGGAVNLCFNNIDNLGVIESVGGDLYLRDTDIEDLGCLKYIGGRLTLPYRVKNKIDLSTITIKGSVRYYKTTERKLTKSQCGLTPSDIPIPIINGKINSNYVSNYIQHISEASKEQMEFFNYFKKRFYDGVILDVRGFYEYPKFLMQSMIENDVIQFERWMKDYDRLIMAYPMISEDAAHMLIYNSSRYDVGWELEKRKSYVDISHIGYYEEKLSKVLFNVEFLLNTDGAVGLSPWGKQHMEEIKPFIKKQFDEFQNKWNSNFLHIFVDEKLNPDKEYSFYKQFYITEEQFNYYNNIEYGKFIPTNYNDYLPILVINAIKEQCKKITIEAEDSYRESIGMPKIGEYWRSETELYYSIKEAFRDIEVKQHASPKWLGLQHLDVYIPGFNIGIEYQGVQHFRPIDYFGGEEAFKKGQERDARKKELCKANGCALIYVEEGYDLNAVINIIRQIINDRNHK